MFRLFKEAIRIIYSLQLPSSRLHENAPLAEEKRGEEIRGDLSTRGCLAHSSTAFNQVSTNGVSEVICLDIHEVEVLVLLLYRFMRLRVFVACLSLPLKF